MPFERLIALSVFLLLFSCSVQRHATAQVPDVDRLQMVEWANNGMTKDPVALSFDHQGKLYVVESARRSSVDIDIRAHRDWLLEDLANDDFESMRSFFRRRMASSLSEQNKSWLQDRNGDGIHDYHDLKTISERIRLIEDTDGDGKADKSTLYAEGFNEEFTGVAAGVMPYRGDVLFTVYPDLWRLRDLDGDGKADGRVSLFRGFGVHAAFDGHDLHGLTVGPEGKIYFSCGDNGFSVVNKEGQRLHHPNTGGVLRMNPDGSDLEVFAYGLRNVQEFDFDQYGNMFGVDNDGDLEDERERAVYIAEGSDSGWRLNWQFRADGWKQFNGGMTYNPWTAEGMWKPQHADQPAYITPPMQNYSVGPGGFKFNPGTALNDDYRDFFFCVQFPVQKITAFRTEPKGAGFEMVDEHVFNGGLMVSSLNFGPDGGCYLADWIGKWAPNEEGIIYRVDDPQVRGSAQRSEVQHIINHGVSGRTGDELFELIGHSDRRVRQLAQFELVRRRLGRQLLAHARDENAAQLGRIHSLWGLIQLRDAVINSRFGGELPWKDVDAQIRQQCARVAGDLRLHAAEATLIQQLKDDSALVRSQAAIALGKAGSEDCVESLIELAIANEDRDPFIRHAVVMGLSGAAKQNQLASLSTKKEASSRLAAVLALRRQRSDQLTGFLNDPDVRVRREAVRGIHDDLSIPTALPAVAAQLDSPNPVADEPTLRRVISANLRVGDNVAAERLVNFIKRDSDLGSNADLLKLEALECLTKWNQFPLVDRVEGRIRKTKRRDPKAARQVLAANLNDLLATNNPNVSSAVIQSARDLGVSIDVARQRRWIADKSISSSVRVNMLKALHAANDPKIDSIIDQIVKEKIALIDSPLWRAGMRLLVQRDPAAARGLIDMDSPTHRKQFLISLLPVFKDAKEDALLKSFMEAISKDESDGSIVLDVLNAARARGLKSESLTKLEAKINQQKYGEYQFALLGGDAERGEQLYRTSVTAQCIRCHDAGGKGKQAGPELAGVGKQDRSYLLEALIDPSLVIAKGFESVSILRDNGKLVTGTIISETNDQIVLGALTGKTVTIRKGEIDERLDATQSAMPKMSEVLTPMEVRDLVQYLSTLK